VPGKCRRGVYKGLHYMCPHTTIYVSSFCMCVQGFALYVSSYYYMCVLIPLYMCPHTTIYVYSYYYICPHTTIYVSTYCYICVLIPLYMCPHTTIHMSIPLYMCPSTTIHMSSYYYISPHATAYVGKCLRGRARGWNIYPSIPRRPPPLKKN
jgi:hypothetical protein